VCTNGDGKPGGYAEALAVLASCLDCLRAAAESGEVTEAEYGDGDGKSNSRPTER
jgi:hypothetical protein